MKGTPKPFNAGRHLSDDWVAAGLGEKVALHWTNSRGEWKSYTYRDLSLLSNKLGNAFKSLGVNRGDRVLFRLPNLAEFYIAALGINKIGGVYIPSSGLFRSPEVAYRVNDSEAVAVITTPQLVEEVEQARAVCPSLKHVIVVPYLGQEAEGDQIHFERLIEGASEDLEIADTAETDVAFICYTSGTTGDPKGCAHMHQFCASYEALIQQWYSFNHDDVAACPPDIAWKFPHASIFLYAFHAGVTVLLFHELGERFNPVSWLRLIQNYRISCFAGTPTIYRIMLTLSDSTIGEYDLSSWRHGVSAGEPLPADTFRGIKERYGVEVLDGIGMSEFMIYCHNVKGGAVKPGSVGRPSPGTEVRLLDEKLEEVPVGTPGVLAVRLDSHAGIMQGYWNKPSKTAEVFRGDWYYSGDVCERDGDGYFWFKGRNDDLMNCSGYRISPFEVESVLVSHPAVLEAAAVESPDELRGRVVKAFVVLRDGHTPSDTLAAELQAYVKETTAPYKYPRKLAFVDQLPKTSSGKIRRGLLRAREFGELPAS